MQMQFTSHASLSLLTIMWNSGQSKRWSRFSWNKGPNEPHLWKDIICVKKVQFLWH